MQAHWKNDEQNHIVFSANSTGELVAKSILSHNTKTLSSKIAEDKDRKWYENHPQGRCVLHVEAMHQMLKYPEVIADLSLASVSTMPLEYCAGIELDAFAVVSDSAQAESVSNGMWSTKEGLQEWREHTANKLQIYEDLKNLKCLLIKSLYFHSNHLNWENSYSKHDIIINGFTPNLQALKK